jgi:hypothetical protein
VSDFRALCARLWPENQAGTGFLQIAGCKLLISLIPANEIRQISPNPAKDSFGDF